ncbi:MAG: hypothetical protein KKG95_02750, partial [Candidatus Omnitrophica bacterium]|nr:hypothetical protein [Candidatus Omnitrophota bacterium]
MRNLFSHLLLIHGGRDTKDNASKSYPDISEEKEETRGVSTWRKRHIFFIKCVCLIVAFIFAHQQLGWTQGGKPVWVYARPDHSVNHRSSLPGKNIEVPYDAAGIQEAALDGGDDVIVHIQDAHSSLSAQYSIVKLLNSLVADYDLDFIALEGAKGYIDTSILKTFPDKDIRRKTADLLMREGRMSAGEFFEITNDKDILLYGVEDDDLYRKNVLEFREVAGARAHLVGMVGAFLDQTKALEEKVYSGELKILVDKSRRHRAGEFSFTDYWRALSPLAEHLGLETEGYRELQKLLKTIEFEKKINFIKANLERRRLVDELSGNMEREELEGFVRKSVAFKENKVSQSSFHGYLAALAEKHGVNPAGYRNLEAFTRYVSIYETIDIFGLYAEIAVFEAGLREKLYRTSDERALYKMSRMADALKKLYSMELTNGDCAYIESRRKDYNARDFAEFIREECGKYRVPIEAGYDAAEMISGMDGALEFYHTAERRNSAMLANTVRHMNAEGARVAALITGGYHTEGLSSLMRKKELSYLVVVPKFEKGKERPYIAILTGKKKPYQKLLDSGKYQLAIEAFFYSAESAEVKYEKLVKVICACWGIKVAEIKGMKGGKRLRKKKLTQEINSWITAYEERYEWLHKDKTRKSTLSFESPTPEEFAKMLRENLKAVNAGNNYVVTFYKDEPIMALVKEDGAYKALDEIPERVLRTAKRRVAGTRAEFPIEKKEARAGKKEEEKITEKLLSTLSLDERTSEFEDLVREVVRQLAKKKEISDEDILSKLRAKGLTSDLEDLVPLKGRVEVFIAAVRKQISDIAEKKEIPKKPKEEGGPFPYGPGGGGLFGGMPPEEEVVKKIISEPVKDKEADKIVAEAPATLEQPWPVKLHFSAATTGLMLVMLTSMEAVPPAWGLLGLVIIALSAATNIREYVSARFRIVKTISNAAERLIKKISPKTELFVDRETRRFIRRSVGAMAFMDKGFRAEVLALEDVLGEKISGEKLRIENAQTLLRETESRGKLYTRRMEKAEEDQMEIVFLEGLVSFIKEATDANLSEILKKQPDKKEF